MSRSDNASDALASRHDHYAEIAPATDGFHIFRPDLQIEPTDDPERFAVPEDVRADTKRRLAQAGIEVIADNGITLTVGMSDAQMDQLRRESSALGRNDAERGGAPGVSAGLESALETTYGGLALMPDMTPPGCTMEPLISPHPPTVSYDHLVAPDDLVSRLNAGSVHQRGFHGTGVRISVVDSGCYVAHPFFEELGADIRVVSGPGGGDPGVDEVGHGTMVCASVASLAPKARITVFKTADKASLAGFKVAAAQHPAPQIIQNTWGFRQVEGPITPIGRAVMLAIRQAVARGTLVVFAGGNDKHLFPSQVPDSLSVGGVHVADGVYTAASYASGYMSKIFANRIMPDVCGLVGMKPEGIYIALPTQPRSIIDRSFAGPRFPKHDETQPHDGWVVISGTSSGSAQISGVCALLLERRPELRQHDVKAVLARTARPITHGQSAEGNPAGLPVPNLATGHGLVDAAAAFNAVETTASR
jgi:subtilisin family serine protease